MHQRGTIGGLTIANRYLFDALDAHAKDYGRRDLDVRAVPASERRGRLLRRAPHGLLHKRAYFSWLSHALAHGTRVDVSGLSAQPAGRIPRHSGGVEGRPRRIASVGFTDRAAYDRTPGRPRRRQAGQRASALAANIAPLRSSPTPSARSAGSATRTGGRCRTVGVPAARRRSRLAAVLPALPHRGNSLLQRITAAGRGFEARFPHQKRYWRMTHRMVSLASAWSALMAANSRGSCVG